MSIVNVIMETWLSFLDMVIWYHGICPVPIPLRWIDIYHYTQSYTFHALEIADRQESKQFSLKMKRDLVMACHNPPLKKAKE